MQGQTAKRRFWSGHVAGRRRSGQSRREYCAAQGLREGTFNWWVAQLRRTANAPPVGFLPVEVVEPEPVAAPATSRAGLSGVVLRGPGGWVVELVQGFDKDTLQRALDALELR
jgi:hypothetical protein